MKEAKTLPLYKVQEKNWMHGEFSAADNQNEAVANVKDRYVDIDPQTCSVTYLGEVYLPQTGAVSIVDLEKRCAFLEEELAKEKSEHKSVWLPKSKQLVSLYFAAELIEKSGNIIDTNNLMDLWKELKQYLESYNEEHGIAAGT